MRKTIYLFEITQPIGTFYVGKMKSSELKKIAISNTRASGHGVQRPLSPDRLKAISMYCDDPDATFPTPIIISIESSDAYRLNLINLDQGLYEFNYDDSTILGDILDGQHRLEGIVQNQNINIELPVVLMFDLTPEEKAYVFSTINSNQQQVPSSLIYDLFELNKGRSPQKTCHEIARALNSDLTSAFYMRLKMLGKKQSEKESLSQGTFVTYLLELISKKPKDDIIKIKNNIELTRDESLIFRDYFINDKDETIIRVLKNYFNAVKEVFTTEWNDPENYILTKTTGYGGLMKALPYFYKKGSEKKTLTREFFKEELTKSKKRLEQSNKSLISTDFKSGADGQKQLCKFITGE